MKIKSLFILLLFLFASASVYAKKPVIPNSKFGIAKTSYASSSFLIESDAISFGQNKPLSGNTYFYERIFFDYLALGYHSAPKLKRSIQVFSTNSTVTVQEEASYSGYAMKLFLSPHAYGGFKLYANAASGNLNLTNSIHTRSSSGVVTETVTSGVIPMTHMGLGLDMFRSQSYVGFRLEGGVSKADFAEVTSERQLDSKFSGAYYRAGFYLLF